MMTIVPAIRADVQALPRGRLKRVTDHVRDHPDQDLTLAQLSALVHMSRYHFARLFRHSTGLSPHCFVVRARIERAARLLETSNLPIGDIGRLVGFRSPSHFSTVFRRLTNVTPRGHRGRYLRSAGPNAEGANNETH
jgi:AraC family transcriptional regulator